MILKVLLSVSTLFASADELAEAPYKLEVERNGVTYLQVAGNYWQGEYPAPVIDVNSKKKKGTTQIQGWKSLRKLNERQSCTVKNGLYHPWSNTQNSVVNYYTITGVNDYVVTKNLTTDVSESFYVHDGAVPTIKAGDQIINTFYGSEGIASGILIQNGVKSVVNFYVGIFEENPTFFQSTLSTPSLVKIEDYLAAEQWLYLQCAEGHKVFVQDYDLLSQKGVKEGSIQDWGTVVPAK